MYDKLNKVFNWIYNLLVLNFLWMIYSIRGFLVVGIFPATSAMIAVLRKLVRGEDVYIQRVYKEFYKKDFKNANILGYILTLVGTILVVDYMYFSFGSTIFDLYMSYLLIFLIIFYLVSFIFTFTIYNHYEFKLLTVIKYSLLFPISNLVSTSIIAICIVLAIIGLYTVSPLCILLLGSSVTGAIVVYLSNIIFEKYAMKNKVKISDSILYEAMY